MTEEEAPTLWSPETTRLRARMAEVIKPYTAVLELYPDRHRAFELRLSSILSIQDSAHTSTNRRLNLKIACGSQCTKS